jgi:hypothetical protein
VGKLDVAAKVPGETAIIHAGRGEAAGRGGGVDQQKIAGSQFEEPKRGSDAGWSGADDGDLSVLHDGSLAGTSVESYSSSKQQACHHRKLLNLGV